MTGAETAVGRVERAGNDETGQETDPAPVSRVRVLMLDHLRVLRSLRQPTVEQIERKQFIEEYLKGHP